VLGKERLLPELTGRYRAGDIRHCFADVSLARSVLGHAPRVRFEEGLLELCEWLAGQVAHDRVPEMAAKLVEMGLSR
jgi:dTDP-L-rhamnose 4-epimerase